MPSNEPEDRLLNVFEIAAYLGLKPGTVRNKVSQRTIPFEKVGKSVRFRRSTIDEWVKSHPVDRDVDQPIPAGSSEPSQAVSQ